MAKKKPEEEMLTADASAEPTVEKNEAKPQSAEEKKALDRVLKAFGVTEEELKAREKIQEAQEKDQELMEYDITPTIVKINGRAVPCKGIAPRGEVEQILASAGARRHRLLTEVLGKATLGELIGSQFVARKVEVTNVTGEKVSNA